ncbi:MAG: GNAT family N-acetyltransferase [Salaquimonas sp.]
MVRIIRPLKSSDRPEWEKLWKGYQAYYEVDLSADEDQLFARLMAPEKDGPFCLVLEETTGSEAKLLGLTQYIYHQSTFSNAARCYLHDLFTIPEARGERVGEALIGAVGEAAKAHGAGQVYWLTQDFNHTARKLYDRVGKLSPFIKYTL